MRMSQPDQCWGEGVGGGDLDETRVRRSDAEVGFLMANEEQPMSAHVDHAPAHRHLPEIGVPEDHHHGVVGRRSQADGWVAAALL
jgi:hypothetical protein